MTFEIDLHTKIRILAMLKRSTVADIAKQYKISNKTLIFIGKHKAVPTMAVGNALVKETENLGNVDLSIKEQDFYKDSVKNNV